MKSCSTIVTLVSAAVESDDPDCIIAKVEEAFEALCESRRVYELAFQKSKVLALNEEQAFSTVHAFITGLEKILVQAEGMEYEAVQTIREWWWNKSEELIPQLNDLVDFWSERVDEEFNDEAKKLTACRIAEAKYVLGYGNIYEQTPICEDQALSDSRRYALVHSFVDNGTLPDEKDVLRWLDEDFALPENAKNRKFIVCTDERRVLSRVGEDLEGVAIVRQCDLEKVIDYQRRKDPLDTIGGQKAAAPADKGMSMLEAKAAAQRYAAARKARQLMFEQGHPRNGVTYVQHPMSPNTYIDIESFHASMLERKYNELIGVLTELGAKEITCSVENSGSTDSKLHSKRSGHVEAGKGGLGSVEANASAESDSSKFLSLYKKLDTHLELRPTGGRRLPDGLLFYPFEDGWQHLAKEVLAGRLLKASFDLTYRKDYAVTGKYVKSLNAKIVSMIPGYDFNVGGGYESELEEELKELESTTWHYEVDFGEQETGGEEPATAEKELEAKPVSIQSSDVPNEKAESMILGRAKRYAKTEEATKSGMLTDAQRADLEKLASKYGVDDLRLEELIDEAFL